MITASVKKELILAEIWRQSFRLVHWVNQQVSINLFHKNVQFLYAGFHYFSKEELISNHRTYISHKPEMRALLEDFCQFVLLRKPDDVCSFASNYFGSFSTREKAPSVSVTNEWYQAFALCQWFTRALLTKCRGYAGTANIWRTRLFTLDCWKNLSSFSQNYWASRWKARICWSNKWRAQMSKETFVSQIAQCICNVNFRQI